MGATDAMADGALGDTPAVGQLLLCRFPQRQLPVGLAQYHGCLGECGGNDVGQGRKVFSGADAVRPALIPL